MRRVLVVVALAGMGLVLPAAPAFAHAQLLSTEPLNGTAAAKTPGQVLLRFSEPVQVSQAGIRVFDADAERVTTETARHPKGKATEVALALPGLANGNYVVTWRVTSADSHPVHGAFTFRVGPVPASSNDQALARRLLAADGGDTAVGAAYSALRFLAYGSLVLLVGTLAFLALIWPAGRRVTRARRLLVSAWALLAVTTALGIPTQALYANGLGFSELPSVGSDLFDSRFGQVWGGRLLLLGVLAAVLVAFRRWATRNPGDAPPPPAFLAVGAVTAAGLLLTPALAGHAATRDLVPLAVASDLVHLGSVSLWLGGLLCLVACVLPRRLADEMSAVVPRFSRLAAAAVAAILVTGIFQAWREVGSKDALTSTTYGRLLIVKVVVFGVMVGLGGLSRRWVHTRYRVPALRLSPGPGAATLGETETVSGLRRTVGAETVLAVVVLAVTALLVAAEPARSALARPFSTELTTDDLLIDVTVDPAKAGPADFHFYTLTPEGAVEDVAEFTARLRLPEADVGPLPLKIEKMAPGHYAAYGAELPLRGRWELEVVARLTEIDQVRSTTTIPVR